MYIYITYLYYIFYIIFDQKNVFLSFLSAIVDVEGVKTTLKVGGAEHILSNISEIIEDNSIFNSIFCVDRRNYCFFNGEFHGKKIFKQYIKKPFSSQVFSGRCS